MSDFSGIPFAAGTITGLRAWGIDDYGRLVGGYGQVWRPGENVAECPKGCEGIEEACTCGFYAYHSVNSDYGHAEGVIEGYGVVVVGSKGFRCAKARIVGVRIRDDAKHRVKVARNYPDLNIVQRKRDLYDLLRYEGQPTPETMGDDFWTMDTKPLQAPLVFQVGPVASSVDWTPGVTYAYGPVAESGGVWTKFRIRSR